ncbi:MAG: sodium:solute symporter [Bacteroidaceae bacterium]|nr:sodium:solute symporter [Bacteroidaceae bacterium]
MEPTLHWIDMLIVIISVVAAIGVGVYFARRQKSTSDYYKAGGHIPAWAVGMSMFATIISSVTFLAYPGNAYKGNWINLVQGLMVPIVLLGMVWFIVPLFRRVIKLSTYEYFDHRFGKVARYWSSIAFLLEHFTKMGAVLYLMGLAATTFLGVDITLIIIVIGIVVILLTFLGGMEAIVWMDVVQGFLLILGGVLAVGILFFLIDGGAGTVFKVAGEFNKIDVGPYDWDFQQKTFWVLVFNGMFYALQKYGTDQSMVQRYLVAKDEKSAKKATYLGVAMSVPTWALFMFVGTCLFVYYQTNPGLLPEGTMADKVFPHFIATEMPVGLAGLIVAALVAGAISTVDADVNCISAIFVEDYYAKIKKHATDKQKLYVGRIAVLVTGAACILLALWFNEMGNESILDSLFVLYAIISAGIVGILVLGIFTRRANWKGLYIGLAATLLFTIYALLTGAAAGDSEPILNLGEWNFTHHKMMLGVYSHIVVIVVGYIASLFFKEPLADKNLTVYGFIEANKKAKE